MKAALEFINQQNYDAVIVGSDEVWKVLSHFPIPNLFWLNSSVKAKN
ncbi:MAG: hypothetical protein MZU97_02285 [Bacillus subtilis]|nr:hypothetical protein [Bacillus subtilis]